MDFNETRGFIEERNINRKSFQPSGILKILQDHKWFSIIIGLKGYVSCIVHEFYANIQEGFTKKDSFFYYKVYVRGHIYDFSPKILVSFLRFHLMILMNIQKFDTNVVVLVKI